MYFCMLDDDYAKTDNQHRYVEVEVCNKHSIDQHKTKIANADIYNKLGLSLNANLNVNCIFFAEQL